MPRMGFDSPNFGEAGKEYDSTHIGGYGNRTDGTRTANGALVPVGSGRQDEVDRYRGMGEAASKRQAYQADFSKAQADEARGIYALGEQRQAAGMLGDAARGNAPSQAAILGGQVGGQSLQTQMAAGANARGGMGQAAAQMQAQQAMGQGQLAGMGQYTGMRGAEMQHAQQSYGQAGGAMRAGDYQQQAMAQQRAEAQAQSERAQRHLNQEGQMGYEQMGWNVNNDELNRNLRQKGLYAGQYAADSNIQEQNNKQTDAAFGTFASTVGAGAAAASDVGNSGGNQPSSGSATGSGGYDPYSAAVSKSDERAKQNVTMLSDDRTKLAAAWQEGRDAAVSDVQTLRTKSPAELKQYAAGGNKLAAVVRDTKADTYDDARGNEHGTVKRQPEAADHRAAASPVARADRTAQSRNNAIAETNQSRADNLETFGGGIGTAAAGIMRNREADYNESRMQAVPASFGERVYSTMGDTLGRAYPDASAEVSDERAKTQKHAEGEMGRALEEGYKPFEYEYKPGFREQEGQQPGEKNVGPMAQNMAQNPITGNAVEEGPDGLLRISIPKTVKTNSAGIGYLAAKQRKMEEEIARMKGGR